MLASQPDADRFARRLILRALLELWPVVLVLLDQDIENLVGLLRIVHETVERQRFDRLLVAMLEIGIDEQLLAGYLLDKESEVELRDIADTHRARTIGGKLGDDLDHCIVLHVVDEAMVLGDDDVAAARIVSDGRRHLDHHLSMRIGVDVDNALGRAGIDAAVAFAECTLLAAFDDLVCTGLVAGSHALLVQMLELVERVEVVLVIGVGKVLRVVFHHHLDVSVGLKPGRIALLRILRQEALLMHELADLGHEVFARRLVVHVGEPAIVVEAEVDRLEVIPVHIEQAARGAHDIFRLIADVQDPLVIREFAAQRLCDDCCRV